jgi:hypothetical protein
MAEETSNSLESQKVASSFRGILHFPHSIDASLAKQRVYDGKGMATSLQLGGGNTGADIDGSVLITGNATILNVLSLSSNAEIKGNINLVDGGHINDITILSSGNAVSSRILNTVEVGKLRIRESSNTIDDYEIIFGNPTEVISDLFSIKVETDSTKNLYIKHRPSESNLTSPFWINRTTGEVNIKNLKVSNLMTSPTAENGVPPGNQPEDSKRNIIPVGSIVMYPSLTVPVGWFECDGRELDNTDYPELFNILEYKYSSVISGTKFKVPDLRGLFVRGLDHDTTASGGSTSTGRDPLSNRDLNSIQTDEFSSLNSSTGGSATRPKNMALVYCIKW